jgi:hypothetical protein
MTILLDPAPPVNADLDSTDLSADFQPFTAEDDRWAAEVFGRGAGHYDVEDDCDEWAALEAAAVAAMELGLLPPDLGDSLSRTSLVGLADEITADFILHRGSTPSTCLCEACVEHRTRHYARS